ncbi:MAG: oligoendopeptidase F [Betaproteobacteria bacterium]
MKLIALAGVLALAAHAVHAQERPEDRANLADLYPDVQAWNADAAKVEGQLQEFAQCRGKLGESAQRLLQCLELESDFSKRFARMAVYAGELLSHDTGLPASLELNQKLRVLGSKINEATAFTSPELLAVGKAKIDGFFAQEPKLAIYRHPIDDTLRRAPHTLDAEGEGIVAAFGLASGAGGSTYSILSNADMPWPTIKLADGKEVKLDQSAYAAQRESPNREDRKKVMDAFFGKWKEFERTVGTTFYSSLKEATVYSRVRKYPDSLERSLDNNRVPKAVYDQLIASTNKNLPTLHRYFRLRARMLGVSDMRYYDIYPPLVSGGRQFPLDEAKRLTLEAVKPLGDEYVATLAKAFESRWMDVYPRPRKQSGAHMAGAAYDVHPYLNLNYTGNYESVTTIAHEWGHAMHSYLSNHNQPFPTAGYAIFVAEIASTLNEELLLEHMLKIAKTDDERLLYLGSALEGLRATFFRQAMFAEFERDVHARVDKGEPVTGDKLTKIYGDILRRYHGEKEGVMKIDDLYAIEWAYIPHFYSNFYVYQYATSIAASSLFAEAILKGEPGVRDRYLTLLRSGGSDYPYELVKKAGVDLATAAPYEAIVARMNRIMDEIEAILARRGK